MRNFNSTSWLSYCTLMLVFLTGSVSVNAQLAMAGKQTKNFTRFAQNVQEETKSKKSLKEEIETLKSEYHIQIAFKEGLLNNKFVTAAIESASAEAGVENKLTHLLSEFDLLFKKISAKQYVIYQNAAENNVTEGIIKGKVVFSEDGTGIPGASITLKDNSQIGTTSDINGNFELKIPDSYNSKPITLVVAFIGYTKTELIVTDRAAMLVVKLSKDNQTLNEVVVTALGISKDKNSLGYSTTTVKGSEFTEARENNIANALTGKVAGVNAAGLSTGPGGSSRVTIRGIGSVNAKGDNQPLYVINGMPMDNSTPGGSASTSGGGFNIDRGDGIAAINPDDVESITVLKGGAAAALYGSRASNGVILITTKKGKAQKGIGVEFNSNATMENVAVFPQFQYEYGQGDNGVMPTTLAASQGTGRRSWGAKIDGSTNYVGVDGLNHPYSAQTNNLKNYYQTGSTYTNSVALSGGSESITYRFSMADLNSNGILPGTTYDRKTGNLSLGGKLSDKLSFEAMAQYNVETGHNRTSAGDATANPNWSPYMIANTADVRWLNPGYDANGNETVWNDATVATNGYFVINKFKEDDKKNRFIGQGSISYELAKNLVIKGTVSQDHFDYSWTTITPTGTLYATSGQYTGLVSDVTETNGLASITYKVKAKDFNMSFLGGVNKRVHNDNVLNITGNNFVIPYYYSVTNLQAVTDDPTGTQRYAVNSIFGSGDFSYKSVFFVTVTGRNDWFSTLSPQNNSLFYPSVSSDLILSEIFKLPKAFDLLKLRGSYAESGGGGPNAYDVNLSYSSVASSGQPLQNVTANATGSGISNQYLKPYTSTTTEGGIEGQMFKNRLFFDFTYYNRYTANDITTSTISPTSGYNSVVLNTANIRNRGVEVLIGGTPVKSSKFSWNTSYNFAYNDNKVLYLGGLNSVNVSSTVGNWGYINNIVGQSAFEIVGTRVLHDANGNVVYDKNSGYAVATGLQPLGKSVAPVTMGLTNTFKYKRFSLDVLLDGKFGNKVFSISEVYETRLGLLKTTLPGRDGGLTLTGVDQTGAPYTRFVPAANLRASYYDNNKNYSELFLHDGSFVKLRQVLLSYNIPVSGLKLVKIQSANISFVARNLAILYKKTDNFDPESSYSNSNSQGLESIGLPRTRSLGLNLSVKF